MIERDEVFRVKTARKTGTLARVLEVIAQHGAHVGEIETLKITPDYNIREIVVIAPSDDAVGPITASILALDGVDLVAEPVDRVFDRHRGGKLKIVPDVEVRTLQDMREIYTPGVARVSAAIAADPKLAADFTWKGRTIAVVSDGSRVLGLGNIGPEASLPVMEGKAMFYSMFAGLSAVPIVLATQDPDEIIATVRNIAPGFGGIHLEDIASPGIYRVEETLDAELDIPVFHDDQHGTAVVMLAAALRAAEMSGRRIEELVFGQIGLGAAGSAIALLAAEFPFAKVVAYDPDDTAADRLRVLAGDRAVEAYSDGRDEMRTIMTRADILVMTTGQPNLMSPDWVQPGQMIMALSNPVPEIDRIAAMDAGAALATDGSIVNNVLAFPGLFRGALDAGAQRIDAHMKRIAAETIAGLAPADELLPDPLDRSIHERVAAAVAAAGEVAGRQSMELSTFEIVVALVVTIVAPAAQGLVGLGFAVVSVPTLSLVNPSLAPVPQVLIVLPLTILMAWRERAHADLTGVPWVLAGRAPGAIIGLALLAAASQRTLDFAIATIVLAGVAIRAGNIRISRGHLSELLVGTFAGTASMVASIGGPPMALLYQQERAQTIRATLGVVFTIGVMITIGGRAVSGRITGDDLRIAAMLFPAMVAGYALSIPLTTRVSEAFVRKTILAVSALAALGLVVRAL